jgi:hypothetical protein
MQAPNYEVDPMWPKPLPNQWILGAVVGVAVDTRDHVWIVHRPSTLQPNETRSICRPGEDPGPDTNGPISSMAFTLITQASCGFPAAVRRIHTS